MSSPSPTARKLLQKLQPLLSTPTQSSSTFSESQQTIASWMIFNRKKKDALAEGMDLAIKESSAADCKADKLMVLLKIVHRALVTNCPSLGESGADASIWEKSMQLRQTLVDKVVGRLLSEMGGCLDEGSSIIAQVEDMMKTWEVQNVCDFAWGGLRQMWEDGLKKDGETNAAAASDSRKESSNKAPESTAEAAEESAKQSEETESTNKDIEMEDAPADKAPENAEKMDEPKNEKSEEEEEEETSSPDNKRAQFARQDSTMSTTSVASVGEIDYEGVEEAHVEPHRFLEAAKVIAQLQITRDIGGDTAMNLSSAFGHVSPEVEETCRTMNQQNDHDDVAKEARAEILAKLPDDFLDLDLKYAKQSLQTYKEAIRQQKRARLQCLHLLLQSRCSFGSVDAARILFGEEKSGDDEEMPNIDDILEKLKKKKEALSDALALEGLDVEEDAEEEKKLEKEEKSLIPFSWLEPGTIDADGNTENGPTAKKPRSS